MIAAKNSLLSIFEKIGVDTTQIPSDNAEWIDAFNALGIEVESVYSNHLNEEDYSVVQIIKSTKHPDSDHLHVCDVYDGKDHFQIVCGASNVYEGMFSIMAKVNTVMPNGLQIVPRKLRGVDSYGMLCSVSELCPLVAPYLSSIDKQGIVDLRKQGHKAYSFELKPNAKHWIEYLMLNDDIFDLSISTNVSYLNGLVPLALALLAYWNIPSDQTNLTKIVSDNLDNNKFIDQAGIMNFNNEVNDDGFYCKRMELAKHFIVIKDKANQFANLFSLYFGIATTALGINTLFDDQAKITKLSEDTTLVNTNNQTYIISSGNIVLKHKNDVVSVSCVLVNKDYLPQPNDLGFKIFYTLTDYVAVLKLVNDLKLNLTNHIATKQTTFHFLNKYFYKLFARYQVDISVLNNVQHNKWLIKCHIDDLFAKLGGNFCANTKKTVLNQLALIDLIYDENQKGFLVPNYRVDLQNDHDILEEILKFININNLDENPIQAFLKTDQDTKVYDDINSIKQYLIDVGFFEVKTYKLESLKFYEDNYNPLFNKATLSVLNPISSERMVLKKNYFHSFKEIIQYNLNQKNYVLKNIFEISKLYWQSNDHADFILGAMITKDFGLDNYFSVINLKTNLVFDLIRNIVIKVAHKVLDVKFNVIEQVDKKYDQAFSIELDNKKLGFIGVLNLDVDNNFLNNNLLTYYLELNLSTLFKIVDDMNKNIIYQPVSKLQKISKDINITIPSDLVYAHLMDILNTKLKAKIAHFDVITLKDTYLKQEDHTKTLTFNYLIDQDQKSYTKEEISNFEQIVKDVLFEVFK